MMLELCRALHEAAVVHKRLIKELSADAPDAPLMKALMAIRAEAGKAIVRLTAVLRPQERAGAARRRQV